MSRRKSATTRILPVVLPLLPLLLLVVVLVVVPHHVNAKHVSGSVKLSGVRTEAVVTTFSVMPSGAQLDLTFTSQTAYEHATKLRVHAYRDTEWTAFLKEPLCAQKTKLAKLTHAVLWTDATLTAEEAPKSSKSSHKKQRAAVYTATVTMEINNIRRTANDKVEQQLKENDPRSHYWYFVLDDCSLEEYYHDKAIPILHYELDIRNVQDGRSRRHLTHFSGDDHALIDMHGVCLLIAILVTFVLASHVVWRLNTAASHYSVHMAVLWVAGAAVLDATSTLLELIHLSYYQANGIGIYLCDALSAHMEACCDAALMMFLLSVAAGWTLPSSVLNITAAPTATTTATTTTATKLIHAILTALAQPLSHGLHNNNSNNNIGTSGPVVALVIFGVHAALAQWGRMYDDDYESYHHLEHPPGKLLMAWRIAAGLLFVAAVQRTRSQPNVPHNLQGFYTWFLCVGIFWFASVPVWTWMCHVMIPFHHKRAFVFFGTALLQSASLIVLAWLVTSKSSAYHQYSHMVTTNRDTLSDRMSTSASMDASGGGGDSRSSVGQSSSSSSWMLGKKAKVRLD